MEMESSNWPMFAPFNFSLDPLLFSYSDCQGYTGVSHSYEMVLKPVGTSKFKKKVEVRSMGSPTLNATMPGMSVYPKELT